ncbi:MAG: NADH-quinone oxidoreductase subunit H [Chitinivibrionales bacterium]|nr:NADH-quinone oxidoreductase subunit H [Chitinivibrionales bacterium]
MNMKILMYTAAYIVLAPLIGGLIAGIDRIITARMQSRKGPPLMQPFYDVIKLFGKERLEVNRYQAVYAFGFLLFVILTGSIFFSGGDLLLTIFALTVANIFLIMGAYSTQSPYSAIGAERELLQMMAYEPMVIIAAVGMYLVEKSFNVSQLATTSSVMIAYLPGVFIGFLFILTIKFRKSPFDLSTSHHGHQELVKGLTTEFSGPQLALIEVGHWYENVFLLGFVALFFSFNIWIALLCVAATYFLEILIDNIFARLTWRIAVKTSWIMAIVFGGINILVIDYLIK